MDKKYICEKLLKLAILFYGKDSKPYAKKKKEMYEFGSKKHNIKNKVTKQVAIYLSIEEYERIKRKEKHN